MKLKKLLWLSAILVPFNSCDTRDDYFLEHGEGPVIKMKTSNDTMNSEYWEGKKYRVIEVGMGKPDTLTFSISDPYGKECTYDLKLQSIPADNEANGVYAEEFLMFFGDEVCEMDGVQMYEYNGKYPIDMNTYKSVYSDGEIGNPYLKITKSGWKIVYRLDLMNNPAERADYYLSRMIRCQRGGVEKSAPYNAMSQTNMLNEIPFSKEISARYALTAKNKIGTETTEYILVKIKPNRQPLPTVTATCVDKETNEYKIIAGGKDPDGHKIKKWSYLFDYEPFKIGSEILTFTDSIDDDNVRSYNIFNGCLYYDALESAITGGNSLPDYVFYYATFGMSKEMMKTKEIEADFITPTTRSEINHIFQTKGEHTISVRCQDEFGLWSDYITKKIYIE